MHAGIPTTAEVEPLQVVDEEHERKILRCLIPQDRREKSDAGPRRAPPGVLPAAGADQLSMHVRGHENDVVGAEGIHEGRDAGDERDGGEAPTDVRDGNTREVPHECRLKWYSVASLIMPRE
ncbi:hypothetical protein F511_37744 [Dorcoceras hygrometricum]|uniref:Uncharacterized protein n=1 Tax=Dorcoceras hygrometricum TaxID=472368 RepID=A0A2Z7CRI8_9LAMI|nr:hypothetical protein F511_37744 [Dorcoceras hygrometricum]